MVTVCMHACTWLVGCYLVGCLFWLVWWFVGWLVGGWVGWWVWWVVGSLVGVLDALPP